MGLEEPPRTRDEDHRPSDSTRRPRAVRRSARLPAPWRNLSRRTRESLALIGINAAISLFISLTVVIVWDALREPASTTPTLAVETASVASPTLAPPTATLTPGPGEPVVYRVRPGDTLLTIASQFNVTVEEIMAANDLENPNFIQAGQDLIIPVGGLPEPTVTPTPLPRPSDTPGPSPTPLPPTPSPSATPTSPPVTPPATEPEVVIREVMGSGVLADEAVLVFNGGRSVLMEGWTLSDAQDHVYTFPRLFLGTGGSVRIHTGSGSDSATDLHWGLDAPVWGEPGDAATLRDESGLIIDTLALP